MSGAPTRTVALSMITVPPNRMRRLRPEKVDELAESIRQSGLLQPVVVRPWRDRYMLVAGAHRCEAEKQLGHDAIRAIVHDGLDADAALLAEIDENLVRADLSAAERALHLAERKRLYEKLHPETKRGASGRGRAKSRQNGESNQRFTADAATKTGKSERTVQREIERAAKITSLANLIGTALDAPDQLDRLAKLPASTQRDLIARAKAGEKVDVRVAVMKERRLLRERELAEGTKAAAEALGKNLYGVIYADPPWKFRTYSMCGQIMTSPENHYPCMELDDIKALTIPAADDCVLFLWATIPLLPEAFEVINAWGFTYKSATVWVKDRAGVGYWVRGQAEMLLIGTRGDVPAPGPGNQPPAVIDAPRRRHSEKPDMFAEHIERLFPNVPKLEMFARKARPGWSVWGNEAPAAEAAE
jgi:ParB/RepB/Spo0J family partition protein